LDRTSSINGGSLRVQMACPVEPYYDAMKKLWSVVCVRNDIFTHHKVMLVDGMIHGQVQKYVMTGAANWSSPALRSSDEIVTEIQTAPALYDQYLVNINHLKEVVRRNTAGASSIAGPSSGKVGKSDLSAMTTVLDIPKDSTLDVRGLTDAQLAGQD
jgi:phosphatidylserine/phosphatidylglycerophosphate/cardiolipin synthase-like enzyme